MIKYFRENRQYSRYFQFSELKWELLEFIPSNMCDPTRKNYLKVVKYYDLFLFDYWT